MRIVSEKLFDADKRYVEIYGLSGESKPTDDIIMGSVFIEVDTGKAFLFNETSETWVEQGA